MAHKAGFDAKRVVDDFHHGRQTVGSAARIRHKMVLCGIIDVVIHADADGGRRVTFTGTPPNIASSIAGKPSLVPGILMKRLGGPARA